jgi:hypothetical protein
MTPASGAANGQRWVGQARRTHKRAVRMITATRCGGRARQATRFARRRATSRCRTYLHRVALRRARSAGDRFRASARQ